LYAHGLPDDVQQFTGDNVDRFAESFAAKKQKASTIVVRLAALSSIAKALIKLTDSRNRPYISQDPTRTFEWPTVDHAETKFPAAPRARRLSSGSTAPCASRSRASSSSTPLQRVSE